MVDLSDVTFIIPLRIDSDDRVRNIITVLCFLLKNFNTNVILKEVDKEKIFEDYALPQILEFVEDDINKLNYIFEKSDDPVFYRMKILNEMVHQTKTSIVVNYDSDVLFNIETYKKCYDLILNGTYDLIYPYGFGDYQKQIYADDDLVSDFLNLDFDFSVLEKKQNYYMSQYGHAQFFNKKTYIAGGMENENFKGSSPEDKERFFRFTTLGYKVGRVDDYVYHLEHQRNNNSWPTSFHANPYMNQNIELWEKLQKMNKKELKDYYSNQEYLKKYK